MKEDILARDRELTKPKKPRATTLLGRMQECTALTPVVIRCPYGNEVWFEAMEFIEKALADATAD